MEAVLNCLTQLTDTQLKTAVSPATPPSPPAELPMSETRLPALERYDGDPGTCRSFLSTCSLVFELQLSYFLSECAKVAYLVTFLSGKGCVSGGRQCGMATLRPRHSDPPDSEPMQLSHTRLSQQECHWRYDRHLCMYCGGADYLLCSCLLKAFAHQ